MSADEARDRGVVARGSVPKLRPSFSMPVRVERAGREPDEPFVLPVGHLGWASVIRTILVQPHLAAPYPPIGNGPKPPEGWGRRRADSPTPPSTIVT
jgi:hypothetical protein